jgi:hypothetical protein
MPDRKEEAREAEHRRQEEHWQHGLRRARREHELEQWVRIAETALERPERAVAATEDHSRPLAECWFGFAYAGTIKLPNGQTVNIDRSDGAYPTPHWAGKFVILVDDGDADQPPDKEGRVKFR